MQPDFATNTTAMARFEMGDLSFSVANQRKTEKPSLESVRV
jgi:hypothetical protein